MSLNFLKIILKINRQINYFLVKFLLMVINYSFHAINYKFHYLAITLNKINH